MYAAYYRLRDLPFQLGPDPRFFFGSSGHSKALSYLSYGMAQGEGFIVITGEIGAGKTTLVGHLFEELDQSRYVAAKVVTTQLLADDMLRIAANALGVPNQDLDKATLLKRIEDFLRANHAAGKRTLLVVDEAQNLSAGALEELRMLSNFQEGSSPLLQTFLLGQPGFRDLLASPQLDQLRQRVIASYHLGPLGREETRGYIEHRLARAGWQNDPTFTAAAFEAIHRRTDGVPRRINLLCSRLLLYGYLEQQHSIDAPVVEQVAVELEDELPPVRPTRLARPVLSNTYGIDDLNERLNELQANVREQDRRVAGSGRRAGGPANALTVDVEEWFQVQAMAGRVAPADWPYLESRIERNVDKVLALLAEHEAFATFFVLGWVAERHKSLIRRIAAAGHEIASHGYAHQRADQQSPKSFRADVGRTRRLLEDLAGVPVRGYRAPSFSVGKTNLWVYEVLAEEGYAYSSSIYPIRHDIYGMPDAPRFAHRPRGMDGVVEIPVSTVESWRGNLPCGGGGHFRLKPYRVSRRRLRRINRAEGQPCVFYFHPWELDPGQPRQKGLPLRARFRHYHNLRRMAGRLNRLLADFRWDRMDRVFHDEVEG